MTAQRPDLFNHQDKTYSIIGIKGEGLPHPTDFDLQPSMWSTACYRGYVATYSVKDNGLLLSELHIGHLAKGSEWKPINGVSPETHYMSVYTLKDGEKQPKTIEDGKIYSNLQVETYFSGGILIGADFISELYVHMGFGKPYQFEHVYEMVFHEGTLIKEIDHSPKAAAWRERIYQQREEDNQRMEELRQAGHSENEIYKIISGERPSKDEMMKGIEWRFSLDYDNWF